MTSCYKTYSPQTTSATRTLKANINTLSLSVSIKPKKAKQGLRSVKLLVPKDNLMGDPSLCPDGKPASGYANISTRKAINAIENLAKSSYFDYAKKYYSERTITENAPPPPNDAENYSKPNRIRVESPNIHIQITVHDDYWYTYYEATLPWDEKARTSLISIRKSLSLFGEGRRLIDDLIEQMDDSQ